MIKENKLFLVKFGYAPSCIESAIYSAPDELHVIAKVLEEYGGDDDYGSENYVYVDGKPDSQATSDYERVEFSVFELPPTFAGSTKRLHVAYSCC